jgi:hypothetical protein
MKRPSALTGTERHFWLSLSFHKKAFVRQLAEHLQPIPFHEAEGLDLCRRQVTREEFKDEQQLLVGKFCPTCG